MKTKFLVSSALVATLAFANPAGAQRVNPAEFATPPAKYRPTVSIDEGAGYSAPLEEAARRALVDLDAGGIMIAPQGDPKRAKPMDMAALARLRVGLLDQYPPYATPWLPKALPGEARFGSYFADGKAGPGGAKPLGYMTQAWFATMHTVLDLAQRNGRIATFYDEAGFPSGSADHTIPARYYRKVLRRDETSISAGQPYVLNLPSDQLVTSVVALDTSTGDRVNLLALAKDRRIEWTAPPGNWLIQRFSINTASENAMGPDYNGTADFLDPEATAWFIQHSYDRARAGLPQYFGSTIRYTFFDDVGIFMDEKTWNPAINARFEKITGKSASTYYPALWGDIGPDTAAARIGFFKARSEILGETFPRLITEWAHANGVRSTGHAPGNYDLQPTDTIGDPFKFYAYTDLPMADIVWGYGFARGGYKLISSVSAQRDLPQTAAEAFSANNDANGYRRLIELLVRGVNHFVVGSREPSKPVGTGAEYMRWAGRSSYLLQGGRHVADVAVLFPIESLQAFYSFNAPTNTAELPSGTYAYRDADYQAVGEMLLSGLHRDFTFIHPDALAGDRLQIRGRELEMSNQVNRERFKVLLIPGGDVISVAALRKAQAFWAAGGTVIATSLLPTRSAEFGKDAEVRAIVTAMFVDGNAATTEQAVRRNSSGGQAVFIAKPSTEVIGATLDRLAITPDVSFAAPPLTGGGVMGYTHRVRDGKQIYYFGNSSDTKVDTVVTLRGRLASLQWWNPHDGTVKTIQGVKYRKVDAETFTEFPASFAPISSVAVIGK